MKNRNLYMQEIGLKAAIALMQTESVDGKQHFFLVGFYKVDGTYELRNCSVRDELTQVKKVEPKTKKRVKYSHFTSRTVQVWDTELKRYLQIVTDLLVEFNQLRINHYR